MFPTSITDATSLNNEATNLEELAFLHFTRLAALGAINSGTADTTSNAADPTTIVKRPWIDPPEGFIPYDKSNDTVVPLPAVAASAVVVSITVPDGYDGVVNAWSWNFTGGGFDQGSGDIVVQMLRNTAAVR